MKNSNTLKYKKYFTGVAGLIWVVGLLVAGSDSSYMPWVNGIGVILFSCASIILGKLFQSFETTKNKNLASQFNHRISDTVIKINYPRVLNI